MLINLDENGPKKSPVLSDFFKRYTRTIGSWLKTLEIPGSDLSIHYGSGERIWSKVVRNRHNYSIDLPICSFFMKSYNKDENHNQPPEISRRVANLVFNSKPQFYKITYEIIFWLKFLKDLDIINNQIDTMFSPLMFLEVTNKNWENINGQKYWIDCKLNSKSDSVDNDPGDKKDRMVKLEMEIEIDAKLPYIDRAEVANSIDIVETNIYMGNNLEEKTKKIKDNIQDDNYLDYLTNYHKRIISI